jgi:uncharacterized protein (TIGR02058 family)
VGTGNDWHGRDYTKAAVRAVQDAIHHSSLSLLHTLNVDPSTMEVDVTIGVQQPEQIDAEVVKAVLPEGKINLNAVKGGLDVPNRGPEDITVIATAAISVRLDLRSGASK